MITTDIVNEHRRSECKEDLCSYAVMLPFYCLNPKATWMIKLVSGGYKENWILVRANIMIHMQIMIDEEYALTLYLPINWY